MTAASTSTTTETRAETLERFEPKDAIPNDAFDAMILEWRDHPRVRVRGRGESRWEARDAATTAALSATWALGPKPYKRVPCSSPLVGLVRCVHGRLLAVKAPAHEEGQLTTVVTGARAVDGRVRNDSPHDRLDARPQLGPLAGIARHDEIVAPPAVALAHLLEVERLGNRVDAARCDQFQQPLASRHRVRRATRE